MSRTTSGHAAGPNNVGMGDLLRLGARLGRGYLRHGRDFDAGGAGCRWARELLAREGGTSLRAELAGRGLEVVTDRAASEQVLAGRPDAAGHAPGALKVGGMSFLAEHALTIAHGAAWTRLRAFNEQVLAAGASPPYAGTFAGHVRRVFEDPVRDRGDVQRAMGRAMLAIVLGEEGAGDAGLAAEATALFGVVQSPVRRRLLGFHYRRRRERLYAALARRLDAAGEQERTLLGLARRFGAGVPREELLQQVPHWMFTFTGSGTDLLTRTLALVTARPEVRARVREEITAARAQGQDADGSASLPYLDACIHETGRLFPPVTRTFHRPLPAAAPATPSNGQHPAREILHWFPLLQRDDALGPTVHAFRPERWLEPEPDAAAAASNLFLRGARACPGQELILLVCRAALARQVAELELRSSSSLLATDPLPITFPDRAARFIAREALP